MKKKCAKCNKEYETRAGNDNPHYYNCEDCLGIKVKIVNKQKKKDES